MLMLAVLEQILTLLSSDVVSSVGAVLSTGASAVSFGVEATQCTPQSCPGSFYTAIATAWANIGYVTHADVLRFLNTTNFGKWAIILYIGAAITGLFGLATNAPMKNYTWFFIGPALYSFLVGTTMQVQGVNWVVANVAQKNMSEVWRNAESMLANTKLAREGKITVNGQDGPQGQYEVAMPMVFLDELFSATANILIEWTGIGTQVAGKGNRTNLANNQSQPEGPWWLLSTLKWGYIENITGATARNPDVRDALVTFLGSECGEKFKEGINSGAYIAATQARGATPVTSVMIEDGKNNYEKFINNLNNVAIPAPRSLARLFKEGKTLKRNTVINNGPDFMGPPNLNPGSSESDLFYTDPNNPNFIATTFLNFSERLAVAMEAGRGHGIVCSEYLWTIIQALRYEAGQAYYQLIRSTPTGLDERQFVNTLIYGWNVRKKSDGNIADANEQEAFIKHLILAYIVRNELLFAPQITSVDQRFAPSEQAKSYSDAYVRSYGAKAKFIELYNAAIMMPYLQGILAYFLIVAYPIACMLVILPGHYKGFFTWVSFFAWIKIWDVGFAMVQVIERGVWAMVGNHAHMASTANVLIETAEKVGGIGVTNPVGMGMGNGGGVLLPNVKAALAAVPLVCSVAGMNGECADNKAGVDQSLPQAIQLFDKLLLTSANIDLDLSNGWYIYIMSALYLAVPAVTGQLVLGAKAGSASMMKDAWSGVASDGSNAAKTGAQHGAVAALQTNQKSLGQAARAAALRKADPGDASGRSLAAQSMDLANRASELGVANAKMGGKKEFLGTLAGNASRQVDSYGRAANFAKASGAALDSIGSGLGMTGSRTNGSGGNETTGYGHLKNVAASGGNALMEGGRVNIGRRADQMNLDATSKGQDLAWKMKANDLSQGALKDAGGKMGSLAEFNADTAAWEAKNDFAAHASAMGGIAGMNAGNLAPGEKPMDTTQLAVSGNLDGWNSASDGRGGQKAVANGNNSASNSAWFSAEQLPGQISAMRNNGINKFGGEGVKASWAEGGGHYGLWDSVTYAKNNTLNGENWSQGDSGVVHTSAPSEDEMRKKHKLPEIPGPEPE